MVWPNLYKAGEGSMDHRAVYILEFGCASQYSFNADKVVEGITDNLGFCHLPVTIDGKI